MSITKSLQVVGSSLSKAKVKEKKRTHCLIFFFRFSKNHKFLLVSLLLSFNKIFNRFRHWEDFFC